VSAFHAGRGGLLMSYMGRGITRCASVCLRHLAHEMAANLRSQVITFLLPNADDYDDDSFYSS